MQKRVSCRFIVLGVLLIISTSPKIYGQDIEKEKQRANLLLSPFHTMYNHFNNLRPDNYFPEQAAQSMFPYGNTDAAGRVKLAIQLNQILKGNGLYFDEKKIPKEVFYKDTTRNEFVYIPFKEFPEIYLLAYNGRWYYSTVTLEAIPRLHQETFPFESDRLFSYLESQTGKFQLLGLSPRQLVGFVVLLIAPFLLFFILKAFTKLFMGLVLGKMGLEIKHKNRIRRFARSFALLISFTLVKNFLPVFQFPAIFSYYAFLVINISIPIFGLFVTWGLIDLILSYLEKLFKKHQNIWFEQLIPFLQTSLQIIALIVSLVYILEALDLNVTALLAGLSIGGLAFALAAQDTIKNLFGSITIFMDRPFKVGDWIVTEGIDGIVEEIGVRSTRIRSYYDSVLHVPNGRMADLTIDNMGMRIYRRYRTTLGITYDTPAPVMQAFLKGLRQIVRKHPQTRKDFFGITFLDFGTSSLNILFNIFLIAPDIENEWNIREQINLEILELAHTLGVRFAFPTQTLHIEEMPGQPSLSPQFPDLDDESLNAKIEAFFNRK